MKHGPTALIDEMMPVVFVAPHDAVFDKVVSNIQEVKARKGNIIDITSRDESALKGLVDHDFRIPETVDLLMPVLAALLRQIFDVDTLVCPRCASPMRIVACITQSAVISQILTHLRTRAVGGDRRGSRSPPAAGKSVTRSTRRAPSAGIEPRAGDDDPE